MQGYVTLSSATRYVKGALMKRVYADLVRRNLRLARAKYGAIFSPVMKLSLGALTRQFGLSLELGDVLLLDGSWYVTHSGLLRLASRKGCGGSRGPPGAGLCFPEQTRWGVLAHA